MKRAAIIFGITFLALASLPVFASVFGTVKAIVHDPQHRPVQGANVEVRSRTSDFKTSATTNEEGIATVLNVPVGKSFGENWAVKLSGTNLANKHYFVDFSNTFGGSHFGEPRMISAQVRFRFHY
jgi:outer membrane receptor for ferric coprogen and ferric-rhodotorulic acid